jgi:DNA replication and repair protein RecF
MFKNIKLANFRSYKNAFFTFSPEVTVIFGPNGSGKTNILEALYVLAKGTSFRGTDEELLQFNKPWWRIDAVIGEDERSIRFDPSKPQAKKQVIQNEVMRLRMTPQLKLPVVLFEPEDLRLLSGSPSRRRAYIDGFISQYEPTYSTHLHRYERALKQRNNLLKQVSLKNDELFVWDMTLSEHGAHIIHKRFEYIDLINKHITKQYDAISDTKDKILVAYAHHGPRQKLGHYQHWLLAQLDAHQDRDRMLGFTSVGPHRDDLEVSINGHAAGSSASRGETRSIVLALKLIEIDLLKKTSDRTPLLLLDDVFSELDETRREALTKHTGYIQTVITTTSADIHVLEATRDVLKINLTDEY